MLKNSLFLVALIIIGCSGKYDHYQLDKRFWTPDDYERVILEIKYPANRQGPLPTYKDPETRMILEKITDPQNYLVVLDDNELGLKYRNEVAQDFFNEWKDMNSIYWEMDRKDRYVYDIELIECYKFGLGLQLKYFKVGNDEILDSSIDPNSQETKRVVNKNIGTLISNYLNYLEVIKNEDAISEEGLTAYSEGIDQYYAALVNLYPDGNYSATKNKMKLLIDKSESEMIKTSLGSIIELIDSKSIEETAP